MPTVEELKLHVASSVEQAGTAAVGMQGVLDRLDEALARLRLVTVGSVHPSVVQALFRLEEARGKVVEAQVLARGAMDAANEYRAII